MCLLMWENESDNIPVYFDNFSVVHDRGAIVEEAAYYPYGLKIAGLSAKAMDKPDTKYKYQGEYAALDDDLDLNWTDFKLRSYDVQIGRWLQTDPYNEFSSPYIGMGNNPANAVDPDGGQIKLLKVIVSGAVNVLNNKKEGDKGSRLLGYFAAGAAGSVVAQATTFNLDNDNDTYNAFEKGIGLAIGGLVTGSLNGLIKKNDKPVEGVRKKSFMQYWAGGVSAIMTGHRLVDEIKKGAGAAELEASEESESGDLDINKAANVGIDNMLGMYYKENTTNFRQFVGYFSIGFTGTVFDQVGKMVAYSEGTPKTISVGVGSLFGDLFTNTFNYVVKKDFDGELHKAVFFTDIINVKSMFKAGVKTVLFAWGYHFTKDLIEFIRPWGN